MEVTRFLQEMKQGICNSIWKEYGNGRTLPLGAAVEAHAVGRDEHAGPDVEDPLTQVGDVLEVARFLQDMVQRWE